MLHLEADELDIFEENSDNDPKEHYSYAFSDSKKLK